MGIIIPDLGMDVKASGCSGTPQRPFKKLKKEQIVSQPGSVRAETSAAAYQETSYTHGIAVTNVPERRRLAASGRM